MPATTHPFRKKWGQNFLRDPNTITKIIGLLESDKNDTILEIGPGNGILTDGLSKTAGHIHAVEIDPLLIKHLNDKQYQNVTIHEGDILDWDISILPEGVKIIGNLPYYISSPILFHFLGILKWERMVLMFQKELAERIISKEGSKSYGRISVMSQVFCDVKIKFMISRNVFHPKPDVDSAVLSFFPKSSHLPDIIPFSTLIKHAFSQRRKKLKNNLPEVYKAGVLERWADMRPEEISPSEFVHIFERIIFDRKQN